MDSNITSFSARYGALLTAGFISAIICFVLGPVMRETDQAAVLDGAVHLARDGDFIAREFYSYDRHWSVYALLAGLLKLLGLSEMGASPNGVVLTGNCLAAFIYAAGLLVLSSRIRLTSLFQWAVWIALLLCPSVLLSAPLLSGNIIGAGFFFMLLAVVGRKLSLLIGILIFTFTLLMVGARPDFALALPLVCWGISGTSWRNLCSDKRCYVMLVASVSAVITGKMVAESGGASYPTFFNLKVTAAFLVFGAGGAALALAFLTFGILSSRWKYGSRLLAMFGACSLLLPMAAYTFQMFSPRHLVAGCVVVAAAIALPVLRDTLREWKLPAFAVLIAAVVPMVVGIELEGISSPRATIVASRYPTADGHWPMGGYLVFLGDLGEAARKPVDHNQAVWSIWNQTGDSQGAKVVNTAMLAYADLALTLSGRTEVDRQYCYQIEEGAVLDEMSLRRAVGGHFVNRYLTDVEEIDDLIEAAEVVSGPHHGQALVKLSRVDKRDLTLTIRLAAASELKGNDFSLVDEDVFVYPLRPRLFISAEPFQLGEKHSKPFTAQPFQMFHFLPFSHYESEELLRSPSNATVSAAVPILASPMSVPTSR